MRPPHDPPDDDEPTMIEEPAPVTVAVEEPGPDFEAMLGSDNGLALSASIAPDSDHRTYCSFTTGVPLGHESIPTGVDYASRPARLISGGS